MALNMEPQPMTAQQSPQAPQMPAAPAPQGMSGGNGQMGDMPPQNFEPPEMQQGNPNPEQQDSQSVQLSRLLESTNLAEKMDEKELQKLGMEVHEGYEQDVKSRKDWEDAYKIWMKLALQIKKDKVFPWPKAANVKYPLLSTAAMQFNARAYAALVPSNGKVVAMKVAGLDPDGSKADKAERVSIHMSYQFMEEMPHWEEDMDKLLLMLPIVGICFKKTWYDPERDCNCSCLVSAMDLVVNYWAKSIEDCERKTERIYLSKRKVKEKQLQGIFLEDVVLPDPQIDSELDQNRMYKETPAQNDESTPYLFLEQHTFKDLDKDGLPEPYIITIEEKSQKVLRIIANFEEEGIKLNAKGKLVRIEPNQYYTKFGFIPNPNGSFYDIGFGLLLGSINETADSVINQLLDAGTLANMQTGFIAKGLRLKMGEARFQPGEWKAVNATGDDLKKGIMPLPVNQPSDVLFKLLEMLIQSGKELASVADVMTGKMPGQNTPATTTQSTIDQSMQLFTSIYKRIYRSMTDEMRKVYRLNRIYLDPQVYISVLDEPILQQDYMGPADDICPAADPNATSQTSKQARAQRLLSYMQLGTLSAMEVTQRILEADEQPNIQQLLNTQPPPPDPKVQIEQMKMQLEQEKTRNKLQIDMFKARIDAAQSTQKMQLEKEMQQAELQFKIQEAMLDREIKTKEAQMNLMQSQQEHQVNMQQMNQQTTMQQQVHQQSMAQSQEAHKQGLQQKQEMTKNAQSSKQGRI